jgi:hypothetical protein
MLDANWSCGGIESDHSQWDGKFTIIGMLGRGG